jgi:hypothetical protein
VDNLNKKNEIVNLFSNLFGAKFFSAEKNSVIARLEDSKEICKLVRMILLHDVEIQEFKWMVNGKRLVS